jgi:hypothetical protein
MKNEITLPEVKKGENFDASVVFAPLAPLPPTGSNKKGVVSCQLLIPIQRPIPRANDEARMARDEIPLSPPYTVCLSHTTSRADFTENSLSASLSSLAQLLQRSCHEVRSEPPIRQKGRNSCWTI